MRSRCASALISRPITRSTTSTGVLALLAPLGRLEPLPFGARERAGHRRLRRPILVVAIVFVALDPEVIMSDRDLAKKAEQALVTVVLSTATLVVCVSMYVFR